VFVPSLSWQIIVFQKETLVKKVIPVVLPALVSAGVSRYLLRSILVSLKTAEISAIRVS
jgi:hypothetical protein